MIERNAGPHRQRDDNERNQVVKQTNLHGWKNIPMTELNSTTSARKKRGRCQTYLERPVRSMMATTSHAARNPNVPTTTIHGMSTSPSFISGRLRVRAKKLMRLIWLTSTGSSKRSRHLRRGRKFRARGFRRLNPERMPDLLSRRPNDRSQAIHCLESVFKKGSVP